MSWTERLMRLAGGDRQQGVGAALLRLYGASLERARMLEVHADMAPTRAADAALRALSGRETELGEVLHQAIRARGTDPLVPAPAGSGSGHNYWTRLVADLEACRLARDQLRRERAALLEMDAGIADLVDSVLTTLDAEAATLRELIARSDPQALD